MEVKKIKMLLHLILRFFCVYLGVVIGNYLLYNKFVLRLGLNDSFIVFSVFMMLEIIEIKKKLIDKE